MSNRPVVLIFNKFYLPGFKAGGPIRTIANMVDRLGAEFDFYIVTQDRDGGLSAPYQGITRGVWVEVGRGKVMYLPRGDIKMLRLLRLIRDVRPSVVYLNSFFDKVFTQRVLWLRRVGKMPGIPVVLAPRGEFSPGALGLCSTRKALYLSCVSAVGLYRGLTWQASSDLERTEILRAFSGASLGRIVVAQDVAPDESGQAIISIGSRADGAPLRICFLSRISQKKNLDFALRVLRQVRVPVVFTIYGPQEVPTYWQLCADLIAALPENICVVYNGQVEASLVNGVLRDHDMFFFPTRGENYGHVIYEALRAGLPVLLSDQTPWSIVNEEQIGWTLPLESTQPFVDVIEMVSEWDTSKRGFVAQRASEYASRMATSPAVLEDNRRLFIDSIGPVRP